jgi:hypothetical protein
MLYLALRVRWCDIIFMIAHEYTEDINDDSKDRFCEKIEQMLIVFFSTT